MRVATFLTPEAKADEGEVESLLDLSFGSQRASRPSYALRAGYAPESRLCWVVRDGTAQIRAAVRYWRIAVEGKAEPTLLLGPLAVDPAMRGQGLADRLMRHTLGLAQRGGFVLVFLVGEPDLYARWGFVSATSFGYFMPGNPEPRRLRVRELELGALTRDSRPRALLSYSPPEP